MLRYVPHSSCQKVCMCAFITESILHPFDAGLEFFYAQSPHKMRGMMIGFFFFAWGVATAMAQVFIVAFDKPSSVLTCDFWYYLLYLCLAIFGCAAYAVLARCYRNRQRGEQESDRYYRPQDWSFHFQIHSVVFPYSLHKSKTINAQFAQNNAEKRKFKCKDKQLSILTLILLHTWAHLILATRTLTNQPQHAMLQPTKSFLLYCILTH